MVAPLGVLSACPTTATTEVEDVDGGPPGTRGSARAHLSKETRFRVEGHVVAPELTSARRRGPRSWDT
jgi:hypothetical protein